MSDIVDAWAEQAAKWEKGFSHLTAYVPAEGHPLIPVFLGRFSQKPKTASDLDTSI